MATLLETHVLYYCTLFALFLSSKPEACFRRPSHKEAPTRVYPCTSDHHRSVLITSCSLTPTSMLDVLPPDIVLIILSYLPIRQLQYLTQLSTDWKQFIETHESNVYHATAILHGFVPPNTVLEEAANGQTWLIECCPGIYSWKDLCRLLRLSMSLLTIDIGSQVVNTIIWKANGKVMSNQLLRMCQVQGEQYGDSKLIQNRGRLSPLTLMVD